VTTPLRPYDRQWNEIKPAVEDMQTKLWRLEKIRSAVPAADQKQMDQAKALIQRKRTRY